MGVVGGFFNFNGAIKKVYIAIEKKVNDINYNMREVRQAEIYIQNLNFYFIYFITIVVVYYDHRASLIAFHG